MHVHTERESWIIRENEKGALLFAQGYAHIRWIDKILKIFNFKSWKRVLCKYPCMANF